MLQDASRIKTLNVDVDEFLGLATFLSDLVSETIMGGPTPPYDHDPKGPDNNRNHTNKLISLLIINRIIIIGPFGLVVIRGHGAPYRSRSRAKVD